jgi:hypothetical protein
MNYGFDPIGNLDHIDHVKSNNKLENLRDVSHKENHKNKTLSKRNTSGYSNIKIIERNRKYQVCFNVEKYRKSFLILDEAIKHRNEKYLEFGYHENHGK